MLRLIAFFLSPVLASADWTQFRGPNASGISEEIVPKSWSDSENIAWSVALPGPGSSSPIVVGEKLLLTCYTGEGAGILRHLLCFNTSDGALHWKREIPVWHPEDPARGFILEHGWASNTPVTDGAHVFVYAGKAGVHAFDLEGAPLWKAETGALSSQKAWGSASSPILQGDLLIVPAGDETRSVLALQKTDGSLVWEAKGGPTEQTYGTPVLHVVDEARTDILIPVTGELWGVNPESGKLRWFAEFNLPGNMSNTPVISENIVTLSGGFPRTARVAMPLGQKGDISNAILYDTSSPATYMTAPVFHDGVLYWISDSGIAFAAEPGEEDPLWEERIPGLNQGRGKPFYTSPICAGGTIYAVSRTNGTFVITPSREGLNVIAQNKFSSDSSRFHGTPAASDGTLFLRSDTHLYAVR
ncbi:MAG: PQQ-binding-like beta-propeller repeat protein [Verrucomicrobiota bacterium]